MPNAGEDKLQHAVQRLESLTDANSGVVGRERDVMDLVIYLAGLPNKLVADQLLRDASACARWRCTARACSTRWA